MLKIHLILTLFLGSFSLAQVNPVKGDIRAVILSDFNGSYGSLTYTTDLHRIIELIPTWQADIVLSAGDLIAGQRTSLTDEQLFAMWSSFDTYVAKPLRDQSIPYAFALGNHDGSSLKQAGGYVFARERLAAANYWQQEMYKGNLNYQERSQFPFEYSFSFEGIFFLVWDASSAQLEQAQLSWLEQELSSPAAQNASLRILLGHLPLYAVAADKNKQGEVLAAGDELRQRLEALGLDLYISGHHAAYYPAIAGELLLLHSGGIGGRRLIASTEAARSSITIMDIWLEPLEIRFSGIDTQTLEDIPLASLPEAIESINGVIRRIDTK